MTAVRIITAWVLALGLPLIAGAHSKPTPQARGPRPQARPSLLLITLDTTRADHLGCYGYKTAQTPNLDALAARGVRFENAYASAPITLSSHATIMTGTFPPRHGARDNGLFKLNPDVETLAQVLKKNGYQTAAFVSAAVLDRQFGLNRGFDHYDDNVRVGELRAFGYQERAANQVTEAVVNYLPKLKKSGKPFFLWVHYYDPHFPYVAPNPFKTQFRNSPYDGEIAFVDENLGELFAALKTAGLDQNLYTVAVGDHGEMLGEHGEPNHGVFLYKNALHVPLIIAGPKIRDGVVSNADKHEILLADLAPTMGEFLLAKPYLLKTAQGISFASFIYGRGFHLPPDYNYDCNIRYAETFMPYFSYGMAPQMSIVAGKWHYISSQRPELYDLEADPDEIANLIEKYPDNPDFKTRYAKFLPRFLLCVGSSYSDVKLPIPNANADPELLKALAQLGYVGNSGGGTENLPDPKTVIDILPKLRHAEELSGNGKYAEAAAIYEEVLRRTPNNFNTYGLLANARLALGQPQEALKLYRAALKLNPRLDFLRLGEANCMAALNYPQAESKLRVIIKDNPRNADAFMALGDFLHKHDRLDEARAVFNAARAAGHDDAELRFRIGEDELRRARRASAEKEFRAAIAFNKYHAEALAALAELIAKRDPAAAAGLYRRAIEERPDHADWRAALAVLGK